MELDRSRKTSKQHQTPPTDWNWFAIAVLAAAVLACGCKKKPPPPAPVAVKVLTVKTSDVPIYQQWIGTLDGYPNAQIRAQVLGYLIKQDYKEGGLVKTGDLLFEIDPRPFQAVLDQAIARQAEDEAQLGKTKLDVKRYTPLAKSQAISQETLDDAVQANLGAEAAVQADKAAIDTAKLNLGFCRITSLVDGIAGTAQAQIGDLVGPSTAALTTVSTVDPMRIYFNISEQTYLTFCRQYTNSADREEQLAKLPLELILSDGSTYQHPGKWYFTSRQIDVNTGTIQIAGIFPNPDHFLRPGQYGQVRAKVETRHGAVLLPQRVVMQLQGSYQVAVIDDQKVAHLRTITVGPQIGKEWLIESGLQGGEQVVAEGETKVKDGTKVDPQPFSGDVAKE